MTKSTQHTPIDCGEMELELVRVIIKRSIFIKIMKKGRQDRRRRVYVLWFVFPCFSDVEELGKSLSAISLLNKCKEESNKQDVYVDWKEEKREYYEESNSRLTGIRIKKQMLGNVQFIGQLYKKRLLKEKIM
jgi:hypothetical protein